MHYQHHLTQPITPTFLDHFLHQAYPKSTLSCFSLSLNGKSSVSLTSSQLLQLLKCSTNQDSPLPLNQLLRLKYHLYTDGASLVAQRLKRLPPMRETRVQSLGWEDPLEKEMVPTPVFLPGESHGWRSLTGYSHGVAKSQIQLCNFTFTFTYILMTAQPGP